MKRRIILFLLLLATAGARGQQRDPTASLFYDLELAKLIEDREYAPFPICYNHIYSTGYFATPSARMTEEGVVGVGFIEAPPYRNWNALVQLFWFLELSINYRIFRGVKEIHLSKHGFGDYADRGANLKVGLVTPEVTGYELPGFAFGVEDFMGSKKFTTPYLVATQVFRPYSIEASLGWGSGRFRDGPTNGFFGGAVWYPFWHYNASCLSGLGVAVELDPVDYRCPKREPHPHARVSSSPINAGIKYNFKDILSLTASRIRGREWAYGGSLQYNWGSTLGLLPKIADPPPYSSPINNEPLGCVRSEMLFIENLACVLQEQGFDLVRAFLCQECALNRVVVSVINNCYRQECVMRLRLQSILAALAPSNIDEVVVVVESYGLPCQSYLYTQDLLIRYRDATICPYEFDLLTQRREACDFSRMGKLIYQRKPDWVRFRFFPAFETFFGSAKGKFKYDLGVRSETDGFFPYDLYYHLEMSYTLFSTFHDVSDRDFYFPSSLPNVATDYVNYRQRRRFSVDRAYLEKNWNLGSGYFGRLALGYFQVNYAGVAGEALWYPADSNLAIGVGGALLKKREYTGLGFQSKLRHFEHHKAVFEPYSILGQYFMDFYFDFPSLSCFVKCSAGRFLAGDYGLRLEATRYFESGLRLGIWTTVTNAHDKIHGRDYYNKGFAIEIPFDFFTPCSSKKVWSYGMAAWLRDAGYWTTTGRPLFNLINTERR